VDLLIVEDEQPLRESLIDGLASALPALEVASAGSAEEALSLLEAPPRLVITDVRLPGADGAHLFMEVRRRWPNSAFIFMSAYPSPEARERAKRNGIAFLRKPFAFGELLEAVENALEPEQFSGKLGGISLVDLLQVLNIGRRTAAVTVTRGELEGRIFLCNGEVVHAEVGDIAGRDAFQRLMAWKGGRFGSEPGVMPDRTTIQESFNGLLLDTFREQDEVERDDLSSDGLSFDFSGEPPIARGGAEDPELSLERLAQAIPDCVAAGLVDLEARCLRGTHPQSALPGALAERVPAATGSLMQHATLRALNARLAPNANADSTLREVIILSDDFVHVFERIPHSRAEVLVTICRSRANLGTVVARTRMGCRALARDPARE
jgi:CheY-like chemotaxis protein